MCYPPTKGKISLSVLATLLLGVSCGGGGSGVVVGPGEVVVASLSEARETFSKVIGGFEDASEDLSEAFEDGRTSLLDFREAVLEAREKDPDFGRVYSKWEDVGEKIQDIKQQFEELVTGADSFYLSAEAHASSIGDEQLRTETLAAIQQSKDKYLERLAATKADIEPLGAMKDTVDDTMKALEVRFAIEVVDERIAEMLDKVSTMAKEAVESLKALQAESQSVLEGIG